MKRLLTILLALSLLFTFAACANKSYTSSDVSSVASSSTESTIETTSTDSTTSTETSSATETVSKTETTSSVESKPTANHTHSWSAWKIKTYAFIDKDGSDERVCSTCSATETRKRTENAIGNSFFDGGLQYLIWGGSGSMSSSAMYQYACHEFNDYIEKPNIPAEKVFSLLSKCFNITENDKDYIKANYKAIASGEYGYDATTETFFMPYNAETGNFLFAGYKHNQGNKYTTYYAFSEFGIDELEETFWAFEVEYNRSKGQPNKYLSVKKVDSLPNDIIKTNERAEFEGPIAK